MSSRRTRSPPRKRNKLRGYADNEGVTSKPDSGRHLPDIRLNNGPIKGISPHKNSSRHEPCYSNASPRFSSPGPRRKRPPWNDPSSSTSTSDASSSQYKVPKENGVNYGMLLNSPYYAPYHCPYQFVGQQKPRTSPSRSVPSPIRKVFPFIASKELNTSDRRYLLSLASIYSVRQMKQLKQEQYKDLLSQQYERGFHTTEEYERYMSYIDGPRKQQFDGGEGYERTRHRTTSGSLLSKRKDSNGSRPGTARSSSESGRENPSHTPKEAWGKGSETDRSRPGKRTPRDKQREALQREAHQKRQAWVQKSLRETKDSHKKAPTESEKKAPAKDEKNNDSVKKERSLRKDVKDKNRDEKQEEKHKHDQVVMKKDKAKMEKDKGHEEKKGKSAPEKAQKRSKTKAPVAIAIQQRQSLHHSDMDEDNQTQDKVKEEDATVPDKAGIVDQSSDSRVNTDEEDKPKAEPPKEDAKENSAHGKDNDDKRHKKEESTDLSNSQNLNKQHEDEPEDNDGEKLTELEREGKTSDIQPNTEKSADVEVSPSKSSLTSQKSSSAKSDGSDNDKSPRGDKQEEEKNEVERTVPNEDHTTGQEEDGQDGEQEDKGKNDSSQDEEGVTVPQGVSEQQQNKVEAESEEVLSLPKDVNPANPPIDESKEDSPSVHKEDIEQNEDDNGKAGLPGSRADMEHQSQAEEKEDDENKDTDPMTPGDTESDKDSVADQSFLGKSVPSISVEEVSSDPVEEKDHEESDNVQPEKDNEPKEGEEGTFNTKYVEDKESIEETRNEESVSLKTMKEDTVQEDTEQNDSLNESGKEEDTVIVSPTGSQDAMQAVIDNSSSKELSNEVIPADEKPQEEREDDIKTGGTPPEMEKEAIKQENEDEMPTDELDEAIKESKKSQMPSEYVKASEQAPLDDIVREDVADQNDEGNSKAGQAQDIEVPSTSIPTNGILKSESASDTRRLPGNPQDEGNNVKQDSDISDDQSPDMESPSKPVQNETQSPENVGIKANAKHVSFDTSDSDLQETTSASPAREITTEVVSDEGEVSEEVEVAEEVRQKEIAESLQGEPVEMSQQKLQSETNNLLGTESTDHSDILEGKIETPDIGRSDDESTQAASGKENDETDAKDKKIDSSVKDDEVDTQESSNLDNDAVKSAREESEISSNESADTEDEFKEDISSKDKAEQETNEDRIDPKLQSDIVVSAEEGAQDATPDSSQPAAANVDQETLKSSSLDGIAAKEEAGTSDADKEDKKDVTEEDEAVEPTYQEVNFSNSGDITSMPTSIEKDDTLSVTTGAGGIEYEEDDMENDRENTAEKVVPASRDKDVGAVSLLSSEFQPAEDTTVSASKDQSHHEENEEGHHHAGEERRISLGGSQETDNEDTEKLAEDKIDDEDKVHDTVTLPTSSVNDGAPTTGANEGAQGPDSLAVAKTDNQDDLSSVEEKGNLQADKENMPQETEIKTDEEEGHDNEGLHTAEGTVGTLGSDTNEGVHNLDALEKVRMTEAQTTDESDDLRGAKVGATGKAEADDTDEGSQHLETSDEVPVASNSEEMRTADTPEVHITNTAEESQPVDDTEKRISANEDTVDINIPDDSERIKTPEITERDQTIEGAHVSDTADEGNTSVSPGEPKTATSEEPETTDSAEDRQHRDITDGEHTSDEDRPKSDENTQDQSLGVSEKDETDRRPSISSQSSNDSGLTPRPPASPREGGSRPRSRIGRSSICSDGDVTMKESKTSEQ